MAMTEISRSNRHVWRILETRPVPHPPKQGNRAQTTSDGGEENAAGDGGRQHTGPTKVPLSGCVFCSWLVLSTGIGTSRLWVPSG